MTDIWVPTVPTMLLCDAADICKALCFHRYPHKQGKYLERCDDCTTSRCSIQGRPKGDHSCEILPRKIMVDLDSTEKHFRSMWVRYGRYGANELNEREK